MDGILGRDAGPRPTQGVPDRSWVVAVVAEGMPVNSRMKVFWRFSVLTRRNWRKLHYKAGVLCRVSLQPEKRMHLGAGLCCV